MTEDKYKWKKEKTDGKRSFNYEGVDFPPEGQKVKQLHCWAHKHNNQLISAE